MSTLSKAKGAGFSPLAAARLGVKWAAGHLRKRLQSLGLQRLRAERKPANAQRSRHVGILKLLLPAIAAVLIALVAFWPQLRDRTGEFRLGFTAIGSQDTETVRMINPRFLGMDKANRHYTITAGRATQMDDGRINLENPKGDMALEGGSWMVLSANTGVYHKPGQVLDLAGAVNLYHDSGYEFHTEQARVDLQEGTAAGDMPTAGQGPAGHIQSEGFRIYDQGARVHFTGKARLVLYGEEGAAAQ